MHKTSYFPAEMIASTSWLKLSNVRENILGMTSGVPDEDFKITGILKILFVLNSNQISYSNLLKLSGFRMKQSFHNYLDWMQKLELIKKGDAMRADYQITPKGSIILEMLL